jgi:hypothetical protein
MTKREAAIISAYTGIMLGKFSDMHAYIEEILDRPVWTYELGNPVTVNEIHEKSKKDFLLLDEALKCKYI